MPIRDVLTDYSGRRRDINISTALNPRAAEPQVVPLTFGAVSSFCAGVQKLIQRYLITLMTIRGSQEATPHFGTDFLQNLRTSNLINAAQLSNYFNIANMEVVAQFRRYQESDGADEPLDEQLDTVTLLNVNLSENQNVQFEIQIITMAGETIDYILPIPIL